MQLPHDFCVHMAERLSWRDRVRVSLVSRALRKDLHTAENWHTVTLRCHAKSPSKDFADAARCAGEHAAAIRAVVLRGVNFSPYADVGRSSLMWLMKRLKSHLPKDSQLQSLELDTSGVFDVGKMQRDQPQSLSCCTQLYSFRRFRRMSFAGGPFVLSRAAAVELGELEFPVHIEHVYITDPAAADHLSVFTPHTVDLFVFHPFAVYGASIDWSMRMRILLRGVRDCGECLTHLVIHQVSTYVLKPDVLEALHTCLSECSGLRVFELCDTYLTNDALRLICSRLPSTVERVVVRNNRGMRRRGLVLVACATGASTVRNANWSREEARSAARGELF